MKDQTQEEQGEKINGEQCHHQTDASERSHERVDADGSVVFVRLTRQTRDDDGWMETHAMRRHR